MKLTAPDGHADAEDDPGHGALALPFPKGEEQSSDHDCDETEAASDRSSEADLQNVDSVLPWRLREQCRG